MCCCSDWLLVSGEADEGVERPELELKLELQFSWVVVGVEAEGTDAEKVRRVQEHETQ